MISLKVKTQTGEEAVIRVEEILSIDGKPFRQPEDTGFFLSQIARLDGRLSVIERAIFPPHDSGERSNG